MHELTTRAVALQDLVRSEAAAGERGHTLTRPVVDALLASRIFDMAVARPLGGLDVDGRTYLETIEAISEADGSTGWCVMIAGECNGIIAAMLPEAVSRRVFGNGPIVTGGSAVPDSGPHSIDLRADGAHVSGRWRFASGSPHCDYLSAGAVLTQDGQPVLSPAGKPVTATAFIPRDRVVVHDNWRTMGLRGTGSNDFEAIDAVVPHDLVVRAGPFSGCAGSLFRIPMGSFLSMGKAAVATGIARGAINDLLGLIDTKVPWHSTTALRDEVRIQLQVADAEARLRSARAFLFEAQQEAWDTVVSGGTVTPRQAAMVRLASVHAVESACDAIELVYHAAGTSSMGEDSRMQRAFRDIQVVRQHANVAARFREDAGRVLVGLPPKEPMF